MNTFTVGWREYVSLPELGISKIKAKVDTGARSSCLHAFKIEPFTKNEQDWVRFWIHPNQDDIDTVLACESPVLDQRSVRDSGGHEEIRYVIETTLHFNQHVWPIEITLTNRENMRFRMLLGRTALNGRCTVNPNASFLIS